MGTYGGGGVIPYTGLAIMPGLQFANTGVEGLLGPFAQFGATGEYKGINFGVDISTGEGT